METLEFTGIISEGMNGEDCSALFIGDKVLAEEVYKVTEYAGKLQVSARYIIADKPFPPEHFDTLVAMTVDGICEAEYEHAYSEITGYLWTDANLQIGGHDLLFELGNHEGKYAHLIIEIHDTQASRG